MLPRDKGNRPKDATVVGGRLRDEPNPVPHTRYQLSRWKPGKTAEQLTPNGYFWVETDDETEMKVTRNRWREQGYYVSVRTTSTEVYKPTKAERRDT